MKLLLSFFFFFSFFFLQNIGTLAASDASTQISVPEFQIVKVLEVSPLKSTAGGVTELLNAKEQLVKVKIISEGPQKNTELFINNVVPDNLAFGIVAKKDKEYIVSLTDDTQGMAIIDYHRKPYVIGIFILFVALIIGFSGFKGLKAILSLVVTALSIIYILIPAIKQGYDPICIGILISALATAVTVISIAGFSKKAFAATIGSVGAVAIAGLTSFFVIKEAPLSGLASNEAQILLANNMYGGSSNLMNFQGILSAGVIIASLGAAMDVAVSIASATQELYLTDTNQSLNKLFKHAMNVGRDIMGTMTDTLILAYTGASLPLFLLLESYEPKALLLNMEIIVTELTSALAGSIGIIFAIPLTAIISVLMYKGFKR